MTTSSTIETYVVATTTPPEIVCPVWCTYDQQHHLEDDLKNWEGLCIHSGETVFRTADGREIDVYLGLSSLPDGTDDPESPGITVRVESFGAFMPASDAIAFGRFLSEFATAAKEASA